MDLWQGCDQCSLDRRLGGRSLGSRERDGTDRGRSSPGGWERMCGGEHASPRGHSRGPADNMRTTHGRTSRQVHDLRTATGGPHMSDSCSPRGPQVASPSGVEVVPGPSNEGTRVVKWHETSSASSVLRCERNTVRRPRFGLAEIGRRGVSWRSHATGQSNGPGRLKRSLRADVRPAVALRALAAAPHGEPSSRTRSSA